MTLKKIFQTQALLVLFLAYFASISFFTHSHVVDGLTVVHSHPFSSDSSDHSEEDLVLIAALSDYLSPELALAPQLPDVIVSAYRVWQVSLPEPVSAFPVQVPSLRAPPAR